jgi:hypothetical protein
MGNEITKVNGFHNLQVANEFQMAYIWKPKFTYTFSNHFHPFVGQLLEQLNKRSIDGLLDADFHKSLHEDFFKALYQPNESDRQVAVEFLPKEIDTSEDGAYAVYNWELLFHIPLTIAVQLSKNQRFAEAQRWFHYIFDPTTNDGQYWRFLAFRKDRQAKGVTQVDELLRILSKSDEQCTPEELKQKKLVMSGYETLRERPFQPHAVARTRFLAYQYCVVMKYLDNLIAWGDSLFRQDTSETINEATQIYVLASNLLGPRPQRIPPRGTIRRKTFAQLQRDGLGPAGNPLVELENLFPFNLFHPVTGGDTDRAHPLFGIGRALFFCIPQNEKLLGYWDMVGDRLFKIRHSMNIEGIVRQLPLFEPPIDPGMLVKAAAVGIDISSLVSGLKLPPAPVRSALLIQKALEITGEVRALGGALLQALEKKDAEDLGLLRQRYEMTLQRMAQDVRFLQWKEAEAATVSLIRSREIALERYCFYQRLLGVKEADLKDVKNFTLNRKPLNEANFDKIYSELVGQYALAVKRDAYSDLAVIDQGKLYLNRSEDAELNYHLPTARDTGLSASITETVAQGLVFIPDMKGNLHFWGLGGTVDVKIGTAITKLFEVAARIQRTVSAWHHDQAGMAARRAGHERRADDWKLQSNLAAFELMQIGSQIISSLIREQIAHHEYDNLLKQIHKAQEIDQFLRDKYTNADLYGWMQGELSRLFYEYYKFAYDLARRAEQAMKSELMRPELDELNFLKFNYWDGGRKGLLSGEALYFDLKRMELAYLDHRRRELELTRHISLRQLDPVALLTLKATGSCEATIPEWLYDMDCAGHFMRRIKTVALSIPCVVGPYTSINCTLSLLKSTLRTSSEMLNDQYARQGEGDKRFTDMKGAIQSIVTSTANNDSGMFETNLDDERFLPFEGAGAESSWKLDLPADYRAFDYNTISDVILHIRYTARQGVNPTKAKTALDDLFKAASQSNLALLFSLRHDFPTEWSAFVTDKAGKPFTVKIRKDFFPYFAQFARGKAITIEGFDLYKSDNINELQQHKVVVDDNDLTSFTADLRDENKQAFFLDMPEDMNDPKILTRTANADAFLIVRYSLGGS